MWPSALRITVSRWRAPSASRPWLVNDDSARKKGLEQAKRDMDLVLQLGGPRIAAPPAALI